MCISQNHISINQISRRIFSRIKIFYLLYQLLQDKRTSDRFRSFQKSKNKIFDVLLTIKYHFYLFFFFLSFMSKLKNKIIDLHILTYSIKNR